MHEVRAARLRSPPFLTVGRLAAAAAIYVLVALLPPVPFERPVLLLRLVTADAPTHVAVPVRGVAAARLRDGWGSPRSGGREHQGIDIFAPRGTAVVASTEGIVWRLGTDRLGGRVVWVLGAGGLMHYYAHLDGYADRRVGDRVGAGDVLGQVGTTGNAAGGPPHLHYGIYAGSRGAINPFPLLAERTGGSRRSEAPAPIPDDAGLRPAAPSARSRTAPRSTS